jgi:tripartite-type tricarboxylate transporter receptor subunit TctC
MNRARAIALATLATRTAGLSVHAQTGAAQWPDRQACMILPCRPGSGVAMGARIVADPARGGFERTLIDRHEPGAAVPIAGGPVARAAADAHTAFTGAKRPFDNPSRFFGFDS